MNAEGISVFPSDLIFVDSEGKPLRKSNFARRSFDPLLERAKLYESKDASGELRYSIAPPSSCAHREVSIPRRTFHAIRHTHASLGLAHGTPIHVMSERLGHASIEITLKFYAHVLPGQQAQERDRMERIFS